MSTSRVASASSAGSTMPATAATRNRVRRRLRFPGMTSWLTVPAMLTSRPDAVDMNAANAPAATIAARMSPGRPGQAAAGTRSTTESVSPVV